MIVRTYARRNRCVGRNFSDSSFIGGNEESISQESPQEICALPFSSQDSSPWSFDSDFDAPDSFSLLPPLPPPPANSSQGKIGCGPRKSKKPPKKPRSSVSRGARTSAAPPATSTLMEAQEFGEMMEHVDEVNFALDGLRQGQQARIRRASLLSLLSICATVQQRRLIRAQGMAKAIVDAILGLSMDDFPSTLAASALFYVLASDGQDDHLLDSPSCVRFLLKLLNPSSVGNVEGKSPTIGCKLLALNRDIGTLRSSTKKLDSSFTAIILKVQEIFLSCKELKPRNTDGEGTQRPELTPKWIALLTMEKACLSTISLEDTSGTVRRVGGNFKESLRDHGGLDAVFDVIASCHSVMKRWVKDISPLSQELKDDEALESLVLLLKCLKIMENATFLSTDNQNHLLKMDAKFNSESSAMSFVGLILSAIKILSGLSVLQNSSYTQRHEKSDYLMDGEDAQSSKVHLKGHKGRQDGVLSGDSAGRPCITEGPSHVKRSKASHEHQRLSTSQPGLSMSGCMSTMASVSDVFSMSSNSAPTIAYDETSRYSYGGISMSANGSKVDSIGLGKRSHVSDDSMHERLEDSQDPFAFDEDDMEPSKWDLLSKKNSVSQTHQSMETERKWEDGCERMLVTSNCDTSEENHRSCENSPFLVEEQSDLLDDCLVTAVKVLMNLTNDNPIGCQQIASCGGLDTMATLITCHFPLFNSFSIKDSQMLEDISFSQSSTDPDHLKGKHLSDQELDFLVVILGLLVNLVEKDKRNRSRLAAATVPLPRSGETKMKHSQRGVISLLCSIFLANQGAGEASGEGRELAWNDEAAMLQGEHEAEKMIVEAYAALLLAFLSTESLNVREAIADCLPDGNLEILIPVLERFVAFHLTLNMISPETHAAVCEVIESCRGP
ncbi:hypothetical protein AAC387_Pa02g0356 [Persea americana]